MEKRSVIKTLREEAAAAKEDSKDAQESAMKDAVTNKPQVTSNGNEVERFVRISDNLNESSIDISPESIHGYWFVTHRWMLRTRTQVLYAGLVSSYALGSFVAMVLLDPDVALQRKWRENRGLPPDPEDYGTQFNNGHLFNSPACLPGSFKKYTITLLYAIFVVPPILLCCSRLALYWIRLHARAREQHAFNVKYGRTDAIAAAATTAAASDSLDDSKFVIQEFGWVGLFIAFIYLVRYTSDSVGASWLPFSLMLEHCWL